MKIFAVILHYKDIESTKTCLKSLEKYEKEIIPIIINNDSNNLNSKYFPKINIINNKKNLGFAGGVNVGIKLALKNGADAVLLLNNDIIITQPFTNKLTKELEKYSAIGIIGPAICFEKNGKKIFDIGGYVNFFTGKTYHEEVENTKEYMPRKVDYISGAVMLIKKEVFKKAGYFDEQFFLYSEDVDFCLRVKKADFLVMVIPQVSVYHSLSKTAGKLSSLSVYHQTKSAILFGRKYSSTFPKNIFNTLFIVVQSIVFTIKAPRSGLSAWKAILTT